LAISEALRRLRRVPGGLDILVEDRHRVVAEVEIGHCDAGFAQLGRHVPAQVFVDRVFAERTADRDGGFGDGRVGHGGDANGLR
jgi:hypothetical protein